jgi:hypothetical protein
MLRRDLFWAMAERKVTDSKRLFNEPLPIIAPRDSDHRKRNALLVYYHRTRGAGGMRPRSDFLPTASECTDTNGSMLSGVDSRLLRYCRPTPLQHLVRVAEAGEGAQLEASGTVRSGARSTALIWTNTSLPPPSGWMKPKPLVALNHLTVPAAIVCILFSAVGAAPRRECARDLTGTRCRPAGPFLWCNETRHVTLTPKKIRGGTAWPNLQS